MSLGFFIGRSGLFGGLINVIKCTTLVAPSLPFSHEHSLASPRSLCLISEAAFGEKKGDARREDGTWGLSALPFEPCPCPSEKVTLEGTCFLGPLP